MHLEVVLELSIGRDTALMWLTECECTMGCVMRILCCGLLGFLPFALFVFGIQHSCVRCFLFPIGISAVL